MTKTLNHIIFFPPPKSEYFFQQHWESEYFFRKKTITVSGITPPENARLRTPSVCPQSVSVAVFPISVSVLMFVLI
jgi:hypothetical protein